MTGSRHFRRALDALPHLSSTLRLIARATPRWTAAWVALIVVQGFLPAAVVYLTRPLVNRIVDAAGADTGLRPLLVPASLMAAVILLSEALRGVTQWVRTVQADLVQDHITGLIHQKSIDADLAFYESPEFYDHLHRARAEASYRPIALLETLGSLLQNSITLVAMLIVLSAFGLWLPLALVGSTLPVLAVVLQQALHQHEFRTRTTPLERRAWYHDWLLTTGEAAPEIRLFALGDYFKWVYQGLRGQIRRENIALARREGVAQLLAGVSALVLTGVAVAAMVSRTLRGEISVGHLALFYQAFQQGLSLARSLLDNVRQLYQNSLFLGNLFEFLALEPRLVSPHHPTPMPEGGVHNEIRFKGVTFRYPGTDKIAIQDFNLTVPSGRVVAIVGPNGAGKSTLVKLLCRFYDPESGSITIDGTDLRRFPVDDLRRRMTVLFQQPLHYNATVRDNIRFGDLTASPNGAVQTAAAHAGADAFIERLPEGYENLLGYWFEKGAELSVGEWQRVALARAFLREAPLILLDEPTSSMDPWAEASWLARFRKLAKGHTAILITHRFTTAMLADEIHVMEGGRIVESGAHADLLERNGRYTEWWEMQKLR